MDSSFEKVEETKRNKLIDYGFKEFAEQGFKRASLNTILKNAEVSKGFFYHYFKSKEDFKDYLLAFGKEIVMVKFQKEDLLEERDFIIRYQKSSLYKLEVTKHFPHLASFYATYTTQMSKKERDEYYKKVIAEDFTQRFLNENIDYSLFKDDIPIEIAMKIIIRYITQFQNEALDNNKGLFIDIDKYEVLIKNFQKELIDLRTALYKKGA